MILLQHIVQTSLAEGLGWALVHSLWQGALAALALAVILAATRSPAVRYMAACSAMLAILAAFLITFSALVPSARQAKADSLPSSNSFRPDGNQSAARIVARFHPADVPPWLALFWIPGVVVLHLWNFAGWLTVRRLRYRSVCHASDAWQQRLVRLSVALQVSTPVLLMQTSFASVPVVIGHLRPMILVPAGFLAGMPASQIEAILTHELAHIRRHDYLVNLCQTAIESLLFYHPAIWWISRVIRAERENCCDDVVVASSGNAYEYAAALVALEQTRGASQTALAANGGNLMKRIYRLLNPLQNDRANLTPVFSAAVLTIAAALSLTAWQAKPVPLASQQADTDPYNTWLTMDVAYIIEANERAAFLRLSADAERDKFIEQFWERRDPTPATAENEFKEEHYRRLAYANSHYGSLNGLPGWKMDRGRIYIRFGPPDEIESHPAGGSLSPYPFEEWLYRYIDGVGTRVKIDFEDKDRTGEFQMTKDPAVKNDPAVKKIRP